MSRNINIGWGRASIAPERPCAIMGQFHLRVSLGQLNPVTVSALAIENGEDAVIFVSADVVVCRLAMLGRAMEKIRARAPEIPVDKIVMNATHTHAGPMGSTLGFPHDDVDIMDLEETMEFLAERTSDAVVEAWKNRASGSVAYGYGFATVGHSRRVVYLDDLSKRPDVQAKPGLTVDGHARMYGDTGDKMFSHYEAGTDSFINLLLHRSFQAFFARIGRRRRGGRLGRPAHAHPLRPAPPRLHRLLHSGFHRPDRRCKVG